MPADVVPEAAVWFRNATPHSLLAPPTAAEAAPGWCCLYAEREGPNVTGRPTVPDEIDGRKGVCVSVVGDPAKSRASLVELLLS